MANLMIVGWTGKFPNSGRSLHVPMAKVTVDDIHNNTALRMAVKGQMYGTAGAVWDITGDRPRLVCTWYRDVNGNEIIRNDAQYH